MDFPTWLAETKIAIADVESLLVALQTETIACESSAISFRDTASTLRIDTYAIEGQDNSISAYHSIAADVRRRLAELTHDSEIGITRDYLLRLANIDLDKAFEPIDLAQLGKVSQNAPATITETESPGCDVIAKGQLGMRIPTTVTVGATNTVGDVHLSFAGRFKNAAYDQVGAMVGRLPRCCGPFPMPMMNRIEVEASPRLLSGLDGVLVELPQIAFLNTALRMSAVWCDDSLLRVTGRLRARAMGLRPLLLAVPQHFDLALKLPQWVIWNLVASAAADAGATIFDGPTVTGPRSFRVGVGGEDSGSITIGCVSIGWRVRVTYDMRFVIEVRQDRLIVVYGRPNGPPSVDVTSGLPAPLSQLIDRWIADWIRDHAPALQDISFNYWVAQARKVDMFFDSDNVIIALADPR